MVRGADSMLLLLLRSARSMTACHLRSCALEVRNGFEAKALLLI